MGLFHRGTRISESNLPEKEKVKLLRRKFEKHRGRAYILMTNIDRLKPKDQKLYRKVFTLTFKRKLARMS